MRPSSCRLILARFSSVFVRVFVTNNPVKPLHVLATLPQRRSAVDLRLQLQLGFFPSERFVVRDHLVYDLVQLRRTLRLLHQSHRCVPRGVSLLLLLAAPLLLLLLARFALLFAASEVTLAVIRTLARFSQLLRHDLGVLFVHAHIVVLHGFAALPQKRILQ